MERQREPISFASVPVSDEQLALMEELRQAFYGVAAVLERMPVSRFRSVAETHLETAAMWGNKAITHGPGGARTEWIVRAGDQTTAGCEVTTTNTVEDDPDVPRTYTGVL